MANDMSQVNVPWSRLYAARCEIQDRYRRIWNVPVAKRYSKVLFDRGRDGVSVLEIGAGTKGLARRIAKQWPNASYKSLDIDRTQEHDFHSLDEITGEYDFVCMFDVIEHVRPEEAYRILGKCREVLKPGGMLCATTPNTYHPPTFLRDATHITPWCYDELGAMALMSGFRVEGLFRLYHDDFIGRLIHRVLLYPVHKAMDMDFAKQIMIVAVA
jgi:2-polyprenyl-3-methyl-5-hydroxy-6-metoxy-1,4-benzoquinol methylase